MSVHTTIRLGANLLENSYFENASISRIYLGTNLLYNNIADFAITETLENVTAVGTHPTSIERDGSLTLQYAPAANYELPDSVAVAGATSDWNRLTGTLNVSNPTANVTINVVGIVLSKTIPEAPYTLKAAPSLTATHASFPFKTNFITGDSITVDATGITYNLEGNYGSTKVYDAATQTWAKAEYQSVTPTEDAKVSEAFYAWWEANIMSKLATPTGVQVADDEASWNEVENTVQYEIVVDNASWGTYAPAVYDYTYDESTGVLTLSDAPYEQIGDTVTITDDSTVIATGYKATVTGDLDYCTLEVSTDNGVSYLPALHVGDQITATQLKFKFDASGDAGAGMDVINASGTKILHMGIPYPHDGTTPIYSENIVLDSDVTIKAWSWLEA